MRPRSWSIALAIALWSTPAAAHTVGVSESRWRVLESGVVQLQLAIPTLELSALSPVDRDRDGRLDPGEVEALRETYAKLAPGWFSVRGDARDCEGLLLGLSTGEDRDGADFQLQYQCREAPQQLTVQALLLAALPLGHKHNALLESSTQRQTHALGGPARRLEFESGFPRRNHPGLWALAAAIGAIAAAWVWRRRRARTTAR